MSKGAAQMSFVQLKVQMEKWFVQLFVCIFSKADIYLYVKFGLGLILLSRAWWPNPTQTQRAYCI